MYSNEEINISNLKQFLLGNLPPPDIEEIDLLIISDESLEEKLLWAESELMEDYLDETLSPQEVELFEKNFLVSQERQIQFRQILQLRSYARNAARKEVSEKVCVSAPEGFFDKLKKFFSLNPRPLTAAFAFIVVGLFAFGIFYYTANNQTASGVEFAEINQSDLSNLAEFKNIFAVNLMSGTFRDSSGAGSKFQLDKLGDRVLFRLALPGTVVAAETFKAELVKNQKVVFTQTNLRFYNNPNGQELRLFLPAATLKKGEYQIKVTKETAKDSVFIYKFAIE
jgi:hypothetical protein